MLLEPLKRLVGIYNIFQQALGASQKVFEYLDHQETVVDTAGAPELGDISRMPSRSENVGFHYPGAPDGFRIQNLNLEVKAGEVVALVGPSGGGKTTIANFLPRFYDPTAGSVTDRWPRCARVQPDQPARADRPGGAGYVSVQRHGGEQHRVRPRGRRRRARFRRRPRRRWRTISSCGCRRATRP